MSELIFIAGQSGLVGSAIARAIDSHERFSRVGALRSELDLSDRTATFEFMRNANPDGMIMAAAKVGGILANRDMPYEFLTENLKIQLSTLDAAKRLQLDRVIFLGSSCIYPKFSPQPINEDALLSGALEETNEAYAIAKIAGLKTVEAVRKEFNLNWLSVMPTNVYGPGDNFNSTFGHVLPSLIAKFHDAKMSGNESVILWGDGSAKREFIHSDDLAMAILFLYERPISGIINIGTGVEVAISELAETIKRIVGYKGKISWDHSKPNGTPRKLLDSSKIRSLGWNPRISLEDGINQTYEWFRSQEAAAIRK